MSTPVVSERIFGKALYLTIDGTNLAMDVKECIINFEPRDTGDITFAEAAEGGDQGTMTVRGIQSTDPASLWSQVWSKRGQKVPFIMAPHGNEVASANQPHVTGTATIGPRPSIGGAADPNTSYEFTVEWLVDVDAELETGV